MQKVWMRHNNGGPPVEVEATPEVLTPLMITGWSQCDAPQEVKKDVEG